MRINDLMSRLSAALSYLHVYAALCCVRVVIHLVGEQGHEERKAAGVSRAGLCAVESLRKHNNMKSINYPLSSFIVVCQPCSVSVVKTEK